MVDHAPVLRVLDHPLPERVRRLAARPARAHDPLAPLALGEVVGGGHREDHGDLVLVGLGGHGQRDVGEGLAPDEVDLVALDVLAQLVEGHLGPALAVLDDQLQLAPAELVAVLLEVHLHPVDHVLADLGGGTRERGHEAELDGLLRPGRELSAEGEHRDAQRHCQRDLPHRSVLLATPRWPRRGLDVFNRWPRAPVPGCPEGRPRGPEHGLHVGVTGCMPGSGRRSAVPWRSGGSGRRNASIIRRHPRKSSKPRARAASAVVILAEWPKAFDALRAMSPWLIASDLMESNAPARLFAALE